MNSKLASFAIGRRAVALAIFSGQELECFDVRLLPNDPEKAQASAAGFIRKTFETLRFGTAVIFTETQETPRRKELMQVICKTLRELGVPILEASEKELFAAFRNPPVTLRGDFRKIVLSIFPQLSRESKNLPVIDAAALGLYFATERVLAINNHHE